MTQHTPGPWKVIKLLVPGHEHADYFVGQRPGVSLLTMNGPCLMYDNAEADARLIAAAPRMWDFVAAFIDGQASLAEAEEIRQAING